MPFICRGMKTHKELLFVRRKTKNIIWDMKKPEFQNNAAQRTLREKKELIFWMNQHSETW